MPGQQQQRHADVHAEQPGVPGVGEPGLDGFLRRSLERHPSLYEALSTDYGVEIAEAQETIETGLADPRDARLLGVDVGMPLLLLSRHSFDSSGTPVEWAQSRYRGDRYKLVTRLHRGARKEPT